MKKTLLALLLVLIITAEVFSGDRMMLIEFYTSSTCNPCGVNNPALIAFIKSKDPSVLAAISFHMNWPAPGNDPMYLYNPTDNTTRRNYYGINSIPQGRYDGIINYSTGALQSVFDSRKDILSPITIIVRDSTFGDSVAVKTWIYCETMLDNPNVSVLIGINEDSIQYSSPPGSNGETFFPWVMRKMLPSGSGSPVILNPGQLKYIEYKYRIDPIWNNNVVSPLVYVQDNGTKEVLNAGKLLKDFAMIANPGFKSVNQGASSSGTYKIKIPFIAAGYNSPVTLTAAVEPVNAGITTSFPNGSTISSFPDSLTLQVNSTASVPAGLYKIIVTGTNGAGKSHKVAVDYLVGKSYITVQTQPSLAFLVDNVNYNGAKTFNWDLGTSHTLKATSPQTFGATRYVFKNWSNSGDTTQTITASSSTPEYTAFYKTQFRVMTSVNPSGLPVTISGSGNTFYDSLTNLNISVAPLQVQYNNKTYFFKRWVGSGAGSYTGTNPSFQLNILNPINEIAVYDTIDVGINQIGSEIPDKYSIYQNYPNPFNPTTKIKFDIAQKGFTNIKVFDILGREVSVLFSGELAPGKYETSFNATGLNSGVYFYRIQSGNYSEVKRMLLVK